MDDHDKQIERFSADNVPASVDRLKRLLDNPALDRPALRRLFQEARDAGLVRFEYEPVPPGWWVQVVSAEELRAKRREAERETPPPDDPDEQG